MALKFPVPTLPPQLDWPKSEEEKIPKWKGDQLDYVKRDEQVVNQPPRHLQRFWKIAVWVPMMDEPWCPTSNRLNWQEKFRKYDWKRSVDNPICSLGLLTWEGLHLIHPWKLPCWSKVGKSLQISVESVCWWYVIPFGNMEVPQKWLAFS